VVAGEEAALPLERAPGDDVLVGVAGQQAELERRVVRGSGLSAAARISGFIRTSSRGPAPSVPMVSVMTSFSQLPTTSRAGASGAVAPGHPTAG
jgi:hypothetical protein